ncbi:MAG: hypothetical protein N2C12_01180, partial [Planctomycetales bacterium]
TIALNHLDVDVDLALEGEKVLVSHCELNSDVAQLKMAGTLFLGTTSPGNSMFGQQDYHAEGSIDCARLAGQLPGVLRIREDAEVTSGQVEFVLDSTVKENQRIWKGNVGASQITAVSAGRPIRWERPLSIQFEAAETSDGQITSHLQFESDYLKIAMDGSAAEFTVTANGDLTRLANDLRPLVDLQELDLAGRFNTQLVASRKPAGEFEAHASVLLEQFELATPGHGKLHHDRLTLKLEATGVLDKDRLSKLNSGMMKVKSAGDQFTVSLREPVAPAVDAMWPLEIVASGKLQTWQAQLERWLPKFSWQCEGPFNLIANASWGPSEVTLSDSLLQVTSCRVTTAEGRVVEQPTVQISSAGKWDRKTGQFTSARTSVKSAAAVLAGENIAMQFNSKAEEGLPALSGDFVVAGDVATIVEWLAPAGFRPKYQMRGKLNGRVQLDSQGTATSASCDFVVQD